MADAPKSWNPLPWFLTMLAVLWLLWFFTGGPERAKNAGVFLKPPAPLDSGEDYGTPSDILNKDTYRAR